MPNEANVPGDHHCAVCVLFDDKVFVWYFEFLKDRSGCLVEVFSFLFSKNQFFYKQFWNLDHQSIPWKMLGFSIEIFQIRKGRSIRYKQLRLVLLETNQLFIVSFRIFDMLSRTFIFLTWRSFWLFLLFAAFLIANHAVYFFFQFLNVGRLKLR